MKQDGFYILHVIYEKRLFVPLYSVTATSKDSELYNLKCQMVYSERGCSFATICIYFSQAASVSCLKNHWVGIPNRLCSWTQEPFFRHGCLQHNSKRLDSVYVGYLLKRQWHAQMNKQVQLTFGKFGLKNFGP